VSESPQATVRLDIGCGKNKKEGFIGIDRIKFDTVDVVCDVGTEKLPYGDDSVDEVHCSHFLEHLTQDERVHFLNEAHRVMRKDAKMTLIVPHWCSNRAYGDPTHKWPAVSEMFFYYLSKPWRKVQAPHTDSEFNPTGFACDFSATWGYSLHPDLVVRNQDYQQHALSFSKEAAQDIIATLVALK
jgi:SAM-dependent methyltransferase